MAYADFEAEVIGLIAAATGTQPANDEGKPQTLFTSIETARISIVEFMADGLKGGKGRPAPPYVAVELGSFGQDPTWSKQGRVSRAPLAIAVVDAVSRRATQGSVHDLAQAAADAIDHGDDDAPFDTFQSPPECGSVDSSAGNSVFRALADESKVQIVAATVRWDRGLIVSR